MHEDLPLTSKVPYENCPQESANTARTKSIQSRAPWELDIFDCLREPAHCCGALLLPCWNGAQIARALGKSAMVYGVIFGLAFTSDMVISILWLADSYYSTNGFAFTHYGFSLSNAFDVFFSRFDQVLVAAFGLVFVLTRNYLRHELRARDNIPSFLCSDLIAAFCCPCCAMTQMSRTEKRQSFLYWVRGLGFTLRWTLVHRGLTRRAHFRSFLEQPTRPTTSHKQQPRHRMASVAVSTDKNLLDTPLAAAEASYAIHTEAPCAAPQAVQYIYVAAPTPPQQQGPSKWEIGLFECFCVPLHCCMACCFPCVSGAYAVRAIMQPWLVAGLFFFVMVVGESAFAYDERRRRNSNNNRYYYYYYYFEDDEDFFVFTTWKIISGICALGFIFGVMYMRLLTRQVFNIPGSSLEDFCASFWCSCCALSQMSAHGERIKHKATGATTLPPYHFP